MEPKLLTHVKPSEGSFKVWRNEKPYRHNPWHYHPEFELTLIERGQGTLFVGDHFETYGNLELVLIGGNLPHEWRNANKPEASDEDDSKSLAIHFLPDFMGSQFINLPENLAFKHLLDTAQLGMRFTDEKTVLRVNHLLEKMLTTLGLKRIILFCEIMECLSSDSQYVKLCSEGFTQTLKNMETEKISLVFQYLMKNFRHDISLDEVSDKTCMTPNAFCRWFKKTSGKTFIEYLNEIRTGYSKKLLRQGNLSISQIAYETGFRNISNFNKQFKNINGMTPSEYKRTIVS